MLVACMCSLCVPKHTFCQPNVLACAPQNVGITTEWVVGALVAPSAGGQLDVTRVVGADLLEGPWNALKNTSDLSG